jgi:hypothetical protein
MFSLKLFLGFLADELFSKELKQANPYLVSLFFKKEQYLQEVRHEGKCFFGKSLPPFPTLEQIEDLEKHLLSLLKQVAPRYPFANNPLCVLTLHG